MVLTAGKFKIISNCLFEQHLLNIAWSKLILNHFIMFNEHFSLLEIKTTLIYFYHIEFFIKSKIFFFNHSVYCDFISFSLKESVLIFNILFSWYLRHFTIQWSDLELHKYLLVVLCYNFLNLTIINLEFNSTIPYFMD